MRIATTCWPASAWPKRRAPGKAVGKKDGGADQEGAGKFAERAMALATRGGW